jgi:hypothetical protein
MKKWKMENVQFVVGLYIILHSKNFCHISSNRGVR